MVLNSILENSVVYLFGRRLFVYLKRLATETHKVTCLMPRFLASTI